MSFRTLYVARAFLTLTATTIGYRTATTQGLIIITALVLSLLSTIIIIII